jgi:hypothetical protein
MWTHADRLASSCHTSAGDSRHISKRSSCASVVWGSSSGCVARGSCSEPRSTMRQRAGSSGGIPRSSSTRDAAEYLGLPSVDQLHKITAARLVPFSQEKAGARLYFRRADLDAYRERHLRGGRA